MNRLSPARQAQVIRALVEGNSIRATVRMTGAAKNTVAKLLADIGEACDRLHDETVRGLSCAQIQVDEIWAFVGAKDANVPAEERGQFGRGSVWTFTAIDADTKLAVSWYLGLRTGEDATAFLKDVAQRLVERARRSRQTASGATWTPPGRPLAGNSITPNW
jgi:hypothetical protein